MFSIRSYKCTLDHPCLWCIIPQSFIYNSTGMPSPCCALMELISERDSVLIQFIMAVMTLHFVFMWFICPYFARLWVSLKWKVWANNTGSKTHMMTSSNENIFRVTGPLCGEFNAPHKGQWRGALMFSLICAWINRWVNNREADD